MSHIIIKAGAVRQVESHPDYYITDEGIVYSIKRTKVIKISPGLAHNYYQVWLSKDGVKTGIRLNRLVLVTFVGPPPTSEYEAAHLDGDTLNNRLDNLQWKTKEENAADRERHGTTAKGTTIGNSRWTEEQIKEMRRLSANGKTNQEIAIQFDTHRANVSRIVRCESWRHI